MQMPRLETVQPLSLVSSIRGIHLLLPYLKKKEYIYFECNSSCVYYKNMALKPFFFDCPLIPCSQSVNIVTYPTLPNPTLPTFRILSGHFIESNAVFQLGHSLQYPGVFFAKNMSDLDMRSTLCLFCSSSICIVKLKKW